VRFGELTLDDLSGICSEIDKCGECPFEEYGWCGTEPHTWGGLDRKAGGIRVRAARKLARLFGRKPEAQAPAA